MDGEQCIHVESTQLSPKFCQVLIDQKGFASALPGIISQFAKKLKDKCNVSFCRVHLRPQTYLSLIWSLAFDHQRILLKYLPAIKKKRVKQIEVIYGLAGFKTVFSSSLVCRVPYPFFIVKSWLNRAGSFSCSFAFL